MSNPLDKFTSHPEIAEKYNLNSWDDFKNTMLTKRAKGSEPMISAGQVFRCVVDRISKMTNELQSSVHVGLMMFEGNCYICCKSLFESDDSDALLRTHADHIVSHKYGGQGRAGNILLTHADCNNKKGSQKVEVFLGDGHPSLSIIKDFQTLYDYQPISSEKVEKISRMIETKLAVFMDEIITESIKIAESS